MFNPLLADRFNLWSNDFWYAVPIVIAIGLVYAATRHEQMRPILAHAGRVVVGIATLMLAVFVVVEIVCCLI
jgi:hypothetical protein